MTEIETFPDREALAEAAAAALALALAAPEARSFVATGGATPGGAYDRLAHAELDWARIVVTLSDERWVSPTVPESNERLVRSRLLVANAAAARLVPLKGAGASPEADAAAAEPGVRDLLPFAAVLLGMGTDGHIGSLFPGAPDLAAHLDPDGERLCVGVPMSGEKPFVPRISLTLAAFLSSSLVIVLVNGPEKRAVIEKVGSDPAFAPPVAAVLRQETVPVRVLWSP